MNKVAAGRIPLAGVAVRAYLFPIAPMNGKAGDDSVLAVCRLRPSAFINPSVHLERHVAGGFSFRFTLFFDIRSSSFGAAGPRGSWVAEKRDVLSDYRRLFADGTRSPEASGIAVLTDSTTPLSRIGDYAIFASAS